jgi:hypothetical protein
LNTPAYLQSRVYVFNDLEQGINRNVEKNNSHSLQVIFSFCSYCMLVIRDIIHTFTFPMINERKIRSFNIRVAKRFNENMSFDVCVLQKKSLVISDYYFVNPVIIWFWTWWYDSLAHKIARDQLMCIDFFVSCKHHVYYSWKI